MIIIHLDIKRKKAEAFRENSSLKSEITKRDNEINSLKHEVEEMNQNLTDAFSRLDEKENELETLDTEKQAVQKERDELRLSLDKQKHEASSVQKSFEQRSSEIDRLGKELKFATEKKHMLEVEGRNNQERNRELAKTKTQLQQEIDELRKLLASVNKELNRYKGESQCLEGLKQNLEKERDWAIGEYVESRNTAETLRREKEKHIEDNNTLRTELNTLKELLNQNRKQLRMLEEKNSTINRSLKQYERSGEDIIDENSRLKNENQALNTKLTRMQNESLSEVTEKYTQSVKLRAELDAVRNELRKRNKAFDTQSSTASSDYEFPSTENSKKELALLKAQIEKLTEDEAKVKAELNTTKNKFQVYMKDRSRIETELRDKSLELEREKSTIQGLEREKSLLQSRVDRLKSSNSKRMESIGSDHKNKVNYLEHQLKALKTTHGLELEAKKVEIDSLNRQIQLATSVERSRKFLAPSVSEVEADKKNKTNESEKELKIMQEKFRLKIKLYEKEIEFINLKYSLEVTKNEKGTSDEVDNIQHDMKMVEKEKIELKSEWRNKFGDV